VVPATQRRRMIPHVHLEVLEEVKLIGRAEGNKRPDDTGESGIHNQLGASRDQNCSVHRGNKLTNVILDEVAQLRTGQKKKEEKERKRKKEKRKKEKKKKEKMSDDKKGGIKQQQQQQQGLPCGWYHSAVHAQT